jgi:hypothetical protein
MSKKPIAKPVCDGENPEARRLAELFVPKGYGKEWAKVYKWYCELLADERSVPAQTEITDYFKRKDVNKEDA